MQRCIIFGAAGFTGLLEPIRDTDWVIAADGGLRHTQSLGIVPSEILGDFDSLNYIPQGATVHPVEKDDTDTMLAIRRGLDLGYKEFFIYGGMDGQRLDHTLANYQSLQFLSDRGAKGYLIGNGMIATVLKNGSLSFSAGCQGDFSVFCMGPDAHGVSLNGFYYPLENGTLTAGFPLGVSNHFTGFPGKVTVTGGSLLLLWSRQAGLPEID